MTDLHNHEPTALSLSPLTDDFVSVTRFDDHSQLRFQTPRDVSVFYASDQSGRSVLRSVVLTVTDDEMIKLVDVLTRHLVKAK